MRTTKELLTVMLTNIKLFKGGLCGLVWRLEDDGIINSNEYLHLLDYMAKHRPMNLRRITNHTYYWRIGKSKPRIKWLKKHINKNK